MIPQAPHGYQPVAAVYHLVEPTLDPPEYAILSSFSAFACCLFVCVEITGGAHPPPAGHTQRSRVNSTAGGRRQSLTDEGRLTHPISGGGQRLDQKSVGLEPTHLLGGLQQIAAHTRPAGASRPNKGV
jgi:hypothetical protein